MTSEMFFDPFVSRDQTRIPNTRGRISVLFVSNEIGHCSAMKTIILGSIEALFLAWRRYRRDKVGENEKKEAMHDLCTLKEEEASSA